MDYTRSFGKVCFEGVGSTSCSKIKALVFRRELIRPTNRRVSTNMSKTIRVGRSGILFDFCQLFIC